MRQGKNLKEVITTDRSILKDYIDACELVKETEQDIKKLNKKKSTVVTGSVKGSMADFPYTEKHFHLEGTAYALADDIHLRQEEKILKERMEKAEQTKRRVEEFMNSIPIRMQRIIRYKYFEDMSWEEVAAKIGRKTTGDSIKMELRRFLEK